MEGPRVCLCVCVCVYAEGNVHICVCTLVEVRSQYLPYLSPPLFFHFSDTVSPWAPWLGQAGWLQSTRNPVFSPVLGAQVCALVLDLLPECQGAKLRSYATWLALHSPSHLLSSWHP